MLRLEQGIHIAASCGGSGGVSIIDSLLDITDNVTSITGVADNGGHSGEIRSELGVLPPGDATHQMAIHIRNLRFRRKFTLRLDSGVRPGNTFLAGAQIDEGSQSEAIKSLEEEFKSYKGRVIPISNQALHLRVCLEDGKCYDGEKYIDDHKIGASPIKDIFYLDQDMNPTIPEPNPEALDAILNCKIFMIVPGTLWGTQMQILKIPGFREALAITKAPIVWICNSVNTAETYGYRTSDFAKRFVDVLGRPIDFALIDKPDYNLPANYEDEKTLFVEDDLKETKSIVKKVIKGPFSKPEFIGGKVVIRHEGERVVDRLKLALAA